MSRRGRVLVVSPVFHGYLYAVSGALTRRGYDVVPYPYDRLPLAGTVASRALTAIRRGSAGFDDRDRVARRLDHRAASVVERAKPDIAVIIRGDDLGPRFWEALDRRAIPRILWLYDALDRMTWTPKQLVSRGPVASYSQNDVSRLTAAGARGTYLPMAFDPTMVFRPRVSNEVVMVGERYANRQEALRTLRDAGVDVRAYGRTWSRDWRDRRPWRTTPQHDLPWGRQVSRKDALGIMAGALAALNLHGARGEFGDGLSTRTFEAGGAAAFHVIDRVEVAEFYDPDREVAICSHPDQLADVIRRALTDRGWATELGRRARARTLAEHTFDHRVAVLEGAWGTPD